MADFDDMNGMTPNGEKPESANVFNQFPERAPESAEAQPEVQPEAAAAPQPEAQPQPQPQQSAPFAQAQPQQAFRPQYTPITPNCNAAPNQGAAYNAQYQSTRPGMGYGAQQNPQNPQNPQNLQNPQFAGGAYGAAQSQPQSTSGEYRYIPPFGTVPPQPPFKKPKEKKVKTGRSFGTGAIALIVAACVLLSFGAGLGGASIMGLGRHSSSGSSDDTMVLYKSVQLQDEDGNDITDDMSASDVAAVVSPSVVEVTTEFLSSYGNYQYVSSGAGSGVIISEDGYIVTNNHVISDTQSGTTASSIKVRLVDGTEYEAKLIGNDATSDIALLKIEATGLSCAVQGDSSSLTVGSQVLAVGNPLGELGGTVTSGIISSTNREITVNGNKMNLVQIDASINPGNSGGGLFNMKGELIGIVNAKSSGSSSGTSIEGLGFAIPVNEAYSVVTELKTNGYVTGKPYIGVSLYDVTDAYTAYYYFNSSSTGVYVVQVVNGFNDSVFKKGDRIVDIDGKEVASSADVKSIIAEHSVGDVLTFTVYRNGEKTELSVTLYEYTPQSDVSFSQGDSGLQNQ